MLYTIGWLLCRWIARAFFALSVEGEEHIPQSGPVILAPNHVSYLDPFLVGSSVQRRIHFMAKKELFRNPFIGWILRRLQAYPVTRERVDPSTLKRTLSLLAAGQVILLDADRSTERSALEAFGQRIMEAIAALRPAEEQPNRFSG
jgi:1-acyl-sn-glycerol-3-phosphate acyltransferase